MNGAKNSDVLIIGGGVIGLSLAREISKRGARKITILERGRTGEESSYAAAGMLAPQSEANAADDFYNFCNGSKMLYPDFAREVFEETGVDIELDCGGTLYLAFTETDAAEIHSRFAWQSEANLTVEHLSAEDVRKLEPFASPDAREALFFPNDWQVENRKLLAALRRYAETNQIEIVENTAIETLLIETNRVVGAATADEKFFAPTVVLTTGAWTSLIKADGFQMPVVKPMRGQMISFQAAERRLFSKVIYSPRGYVVPRQDGRILAGATVEDAGFDKSVTADGKSFLRRAAFEIAPVLAKLETGDAWAGLRPLAAADGLPILGACEIENLFIATAHYRNGILLAPLTAKILADKIAGDKESEFLEIFSPRRFQKKRASGF